MAQFVLEILDGDRAGDVLSLPEGTIRIGRKPGNDLVLADEKTSGVHAEIVFDGGRYVLRDLGSTNGTMMDGRRVTEVVLGSGDTFSIGRVQLRFRSDADASAPSAATGDLAVGKIDMARLQAAKGKGRSMTTFALVLVLALAGGGWFWAQGQGGGAGDGDSSPRGPRAIVTVAGNRIDGDAGACEQDTGWNLRVAGAGFQSGASAHTGQGSFEAQRSAEGQDFAVAATTSEIKALAGRSLSVAAHLRTFGQARAAVRLSFWSSADAVPFRFRTGSPLSAHEGWQRVEFVAAVPPGADRCAIEIVATLPDESSRAQCDDVAITESGDSKPIELKVGENGTVIGTGSAIALRSMDTDSPAALLWVKPGEVAADLKGLAAADLLALSDVGGSVAVTVDDNAAQFAVSGCSNLELGFPAESGSGMLADSGSGFASVDSGVAMTAQRVLLGDRSTRCMVEAKSGPVAMHGRTAGGVYRLQLAAAELRLQLGFRQERQDARERLRTAEALASEGEPGKALAAVRDALVAVPHDAETTALLVARRGEWQQAAQDRLQALGKDLDEAEFFDTRGGFQRVVAEIDRLLMSYGELGLPDAQSAKAMRERSQQRLSQLDGQRAQEMRQRLELMAKAFEEAKQPGLANLVRDYVTQRFSKQE